MYFNEMLLNLYYSIRSLRVQVLAHVLPMPCSPYCNNNFDGDLQVRSGITNLLVMEINVAHVVDRNRTVVCHSYQSKKSGKGLKILTASKILFI